MLLLAAALTFGSSACLSSDPSQVADEGDSTGIATTRRLNCDANQGAVTQAIEMFRALNGAEPSSMDDLVPDFLRTAPEGWTLDTSSGAAVASPIDVCASPLTPTP
jgi:hypothetical protein